MNHRMKNILRSGLLAAVIVIPAVMALTPVAANTKVTQPVISLKDRNGQTPLKPCGVSCRNGEKKVSISSSKMSQKLKKNLKILMQGTTQNGTKYTKVTHFGKDGPLDLNFPDELVMKTLHVRVMYDDGKEKEPVLDYRFDQSADLDFNTFELHAEGLQGDSVKLSIHALNETLASEVVQK